jgi:hypothetical protein
MYVNDGLKHLIFWNRGSTSKSASLAILFVWHRPECIEVTLSPSQKEKKKMPHLKKSVPQRKTLSLEPRVTWTSRQIKPSLPDVRTPANSSA